MPPPQVTEQVPVETSDHEYEQASVLQDREEEGLLPQQEEPGATVPLEDMHWNVVVRVPPPHEAEQPVLDVCTHEYVMGGGSQ